MRVSNNMIRSGGTSDVNQQWEYEVYNEGDNTVSQVNRGTGETEEDQYDGEDDEVVQQ